MAMAPHLIHRKFWFVGLFLSVSDLVSPRATVAERIGDDPSVLLKNYAKRKRQQTADTSVSAVIGALAAGFLQP